MIKLITKKIKDETPHYPFIIFLNDNYYVEPQTEWFEEEEFWVENGRHLANEFALFHFTVPSSKNIMKEEDSIEYIRKLFEKFINGVFKRYSSKNKQNHFKEIIL